MIMILPGGDLLNKCFENSETWKTERESNFGNTVP